MDFGGGSLERPQSAERNYHLLKRGRRKYRHRGGAIGMFSSTLGGWFGRLFILPHMIVGLCLIIFPFLLGARSVIGVEVPATVADRIKYRDSEGARCYKLEVEYDYAGTQYSEDIGLNREQYSQYRKGDQVFVRFLPVARAFTQEIRRQGAAYENIPVSTVAFYLFFATFWNGIVGVFFVVMYVGPFLQWWLLRFGQVATGTVVDKSVDSSGEDTSYKVTYSFTPGKKTSSASVSSYLTDSSSVQFPSSSRHANISTNVVSQMLYNKFNQGDQVTVLYLPAFPKVNMTIEMSEYEVCE